MPEPTDLQKPALAEPNASKAAALPVALILLAAAGTFALTMGTRQSMGLFLGPMNTASGLGLANISLAFAIGQLCWGLTQPFAGMVADRYGAGRVLVTGVVLVALGTALTPLMHTTWGLIVAIGLLSAGGAGMAGPSVLLAATTRLIPPQRRGLASGLVNAGGSFGQFVFVPIAQGITALAGWVVALQSMAAMVLLALPAAWVLRGAPASSGATDAGGVGGGTGGARLGTRAALAQALTTPSFGYLAGGFFVCGFHVAFIATHLPGVVAACALPPSVAAWSLAVVGLFNIVGSFGMGALMSYRGGRFRMKSLLSLVYACRAVAVLVFVFAPKTEAVMLGFAAVIGLTYLSTVPPTAGLVARLFGTGNMAMLFGVVMLSHQIGGFLGAYLGGKAFEMTGSYDWMWWADIVLAVGAALINLPIQEAKPQNQAAAGGAPA